MARQKKAAIDHTSPIIGEQWSTENAAYLKELEALQVATDNSVEFLRAAQKHNVGPNELSLRIQRAACALNLLKERLKAYAESNGGHESPTQTNRDEENWNIYIPLSEKFGAAFEMNRVTDPEQFDKPLAMVPNVVRLKKGEFRTSVAGGTLVICDRVEIDELDEYAWLDCPDMETFAKKLDRLKKLAAIEEGLV